MQFPFLYEETPPHRILHYRIYDKGCWIAIQLPIPVAAKQLLSICKSDIRRCLKEEQASCYNHCYQRYADTDTEPMPAKRTANPLKAMLERRFRPDNLMVSFLGGASWLLPLRLRLWLTRFRLNRLWLSGVG